MNNKYSPFARQDDVVTFIVIGRYAQNLIHPTTEENHKQFYIIISKIGDTPLPNKVSLIAAITDIGEDEIKQSTSDKPVSYTAKIIHPEQITFKTNNYKVETATQVPLLLSGKTIKPASSASNTSFLSPYSRTLELS